MTTITFIVKHILYIHRDTQNISWNKSSIECFVISPDWNNFKLNQVKTWTLSLYLDRKREDMHVSYAFLFSHDPFNVSCISLHMIKLRVINS